MTRCKRGNPTATPGCGCRYCTAVYEEWAEQARGFQDWFDGLSDEKLLTYFGLVRDA